MATISTMHATLSRAALMRLADPNAVEGVNASHAKEIRHRSLIVAEGLRLLNSVKGAVAVEIDCGEVVAVIVRKDRE